MTADDMTCTMKHEIVGDPYVGALEKGRHNKA